MKVEIEKEDLIELIERYESLKKWIDWLDIGIMGLILKYGNGESIILDNEERKQAVKLKEENKWVNCHWSLNEEKSKHYFKISNPSSNDISENKIFIDKIRKLL